MQLIKIVDGKADVQFSTEEILILNNSLNEVCHGIKINDFDTKIGTSREEAKILLNSVNDLMNELRPRRQSNKTSQIAMEKLNNSLTIKEECYLETSGYQITFYIRSLDSSKDHIGLIILLVVSTALGEVSIRSVAQKIPVQDLQNLVEYFEQKIDSLKKSYNKDLSNLLNCHNVFQVQILLGNDVLEDERSFTLRFMINVGHQKEGGNTSNTYVGAEAEVPFENIQNFTSSIKTVLAKLPHSN